MKTRSLLLIITVILSNFAYAASPTRVGNGDDGNDLEGFSRVTSGILIESQKKAVEHLKSLNTPSITHLGNLIPEVENNKLYLTEQNITATRLEELGAFENGQDGKIYARTFARPHSPTRFFPIAMTLTNDQLVALHIHEGLHRALPKKIRENERAVTAITLALTAPGATNDRIREVVIKEMPAPKPAQQIATNVTAGKSEAQIELKPHSRLNRPSFIGLNYFRYTSPKEEGTQSTSLPLKSVYQLSSHLYPFGGRLDAIGTGIDLAVIKDEEESYMGPLGLSLRGLLWTRKSFDVEAYASAHLNSLSDDELKNSLLGRDIYRLGLVFSKTSDRFLVENGIELTLPSSTEQELGPIKYRYEFGSIVALKLKLLHRYKKIYVGGVGEVFLANNFKVVGEGFEYEAGRNRVLAVGPEISWRDKYYDIALSGKFMVNSTHDTDFDYLGDLMGQGVGQGHLKLQVNFKI